jgi:hypothetical protein
MGIFGKLLLIHYVTNICALTQEACSFAKDAYRDGECCGTLSVALTPASSQISASSIASVGGLCLDDSTLHFTKVNSSTIPYTSITFANLGATNVLNLMNGLYMPVSFFNCPGTTEINLYWSGLISVPGSPSIGEPCGPVNTLRKALNQVFQLEFQLGYIGFLEDMTNWFHPIETIPVQSGTPVTIEKVRNLYDIVQSATVDSLVKYLALHAMTYHLERVVHAAGIPLEERYFLWKMNDFIPIGTLVPINQNNDYYTTYYTNSGAKYLHNAIRGQTGSTQQ